MSQTPKLKPLHLFLRNCKVQRKYEINNYYLIYLLCNNYDMVVIECNKQNQCIETVRLKLR